MKICGYFFFFLEGGGGVGHYEIGLFFGGGGEGVSFLYIIGRFKVKIQNGNIFLDFQICSGIPDILDFFFFFFFFGGGVGGKQWMLGPSLCMKKN